MAELQQVISFSTLNNPKKPWICSHCQKGFLTNHGAIAHFKNVHSVKSFSFKPSSESNIRKRDHNGNRIKDLFECYICDNAYDGGKHRPRSLPCGHGFCTQCLESCITRGNKSCPVCRVIHSANSAINLPVSFLLEELIHKANTINAPQKSECASVPDNMSVDICPEHPGFSIHIHCRTHNIKVCPSCTGIDHKSSSCSLEQKKEAPTVSVMQQIQSIKKTKKDLEELHQKNNSKINEEMCKKTTLEREVNALLNKIEEHNEVISEKQKQKEPIQKALQSCHKNIRALEILSAAATNNQFIARECNLATNTIMQSQKWEETLRKELNLNMLQKEKYAQVKWNGIYRSSKVIIDGGRTIIPSLSKEVKPPSSAILIKVNEINLTSDTTTVFLDLSVQGYNLGRAYINVLATRSRGQQFAMLALGTTGATLKGVNFVSKIGYSLYVLNYLAENKSQCSNLLIPMETGRYEYISKGGLYGSGPPGFQISTNNAPKFIGFGYFGYVIAGLDIIERAAASTTEVIISECGIVLGY